MEADWGHGAYVTRHTALCGPTRKKMDTWPNGRKQMTVAPFPDVAERRDSFPTFRFLPFSLQASRWPALPEAKLTGPQIECDARKVDASSYLNNQDTVAPGPEGADSRCPLLAFRLHRFLGEPLGGQLRETKINRLQRHRSGLLLSDVLILTAFFNKNLDSPPREKRK